MALQLVQAICKDTQQLAAVDAYSSPAYPVCLHIARSGNGQAKWACTVSRIFLVLRLDSVGARIWAELTCVRRWEHHQICLVVLVLILCSYLLIAGLEGEAAQGHGSRELPVHAFVSKRTTASRSPPSSYRIMAGMQQGMDAPLLVLHCQRGRYLAMASNLAYDFVRLSFVGQWQMPMTPSTLRWVCSAVSGLCLRAASS